MDLPTDEQNFAYNGISNLPCDVINNILKYMPLDDAVRTSILSREWRYKWLTVPNLDFDEILCEKLIAKEKLESTINRVLVFHIGPIDRFKLEVADFDCRLALNHWIRFLSNHQIREFELRVDLIDNHSLPIDLFAFEKLTRYSLPIDLFAFEKLTHLCLSRCEFKPPFSFRGFANLVRLNLLSVSIAPEKFASFISDCPLLEYLGLLDCTEFEALEIDAPKLESFNFVGDISSICFKNTPLLAEVSLLLDYSNPYWPESNLVEFFTHLSSLMRLELDYGALKFLFIGGAPEKLSQSFKHLKAFHFWNIGFEELSQVGCVLCLIRSSPNLESLKIELASSECDEDVEKLNVVLRFLKAQRKSEISLNRLKNVRMRQFRGLKPEMEFVKLLLTAATALEKLEIRSYPGSDTKLGSKMLKELTRFRTASSEAEVIFTKEEICSD